MKIFYWALAGLLLLAVIQAASAQTSTPVTSDVDGDGDVDHLDAVVMYLSYTPDLQRRVVWR